MVTALSYATTPGARSTGVGDVGAGDGISIVGAGVLVTGVARTCVAVFVGARVGALEGARVCVDMRAGEAMAVNVGAGVTIPGAAHAASMAHAARGNKKRLVRIACASRCIKLFRITSSDNGTTHAL